MDILGLKRIRDFLFPVMIYDHGDKLTIVDRRPDFDLIFTGLGLLGSVVMLVTLAWPMVAAGIYIPAILIAVAALYLGYRSATRYFRVVYAFDRSKNSYCFYRQSLLKKDTLEGDLREFSAVQVEHAVVSNDGTTYDTYRVALLLDGGLNLGRSPSQPLRNSPPMLSDYESEARIANAIAGFLKIRNDGEVDVSSFQGPAIWF